jgi:sulfatase maturation enzyme AslB (radical SAM superfamily)
VAKSNLGFEMKQISDFAPADIVKTCPRIESGLRLGPEAVRACCFSAIISPEYWRSEDVPNEITKTDLIKKRQDLFLKLNDDVSDVSCKKCLKVESKRFEDVGFDKLGFIDLAHYSSCNLRCDYCGFTQRNDFHKQKYDALKLLNLFSSNDVQFESSVDFNGGEPTILKDLSLYLEYFRKNKIYK